MKNEIKLPKRQYRLSQSKTAMIRELSNSGKRFDVSRMISAKDLRTPSRNHITKNFRKGYDQINWEKPNAEKKKK